MEQYEKIAVEVFRQHGLSFEAAERAGGWTNAVWLNGGFALRVSKQTGNDKIRREAERSKMLPQSVGYPRNIAAGLIDGYEWCLSERVQGVNLSSIWDDLSWTQKAKAVKQILDMVTDVHSVSVSAIEHLTSKSAWYNSFDRDSSIADIERYTAKGLFTSQQGKNLRDALKRFYECSTCVAPVLCHGDITTDNLLWQDENVVSLLDFEHSVIAPRQLDIHSLVNLALTYYDEAASKDVVLLSEENHEIQRYVEEMLHLFKPFLYERKDKDLFIGYNILFRQKFFEFWLAEPIGSIETCDAYQKLLSFSDGKGGYLSKLP
jgi:aminoglycoside phosphotransferase (APT) family kinase protein